MPLPSCPGVPSLPHLRGPRCSRGEPPRIGWSQRRPGKPGPPVMLSQSHCSPPDPAWRLAFRACPGKKAPEVNEAWKPTRFFVPCGLHSGTTGLLGSVSWASVSSPEMRSCIGIEGSGGWEVQVGQQNSWRTLGTELQKCGTHLAPNK